MPRIFLSHSSGDRRFADDLAELFRLHYIETWYSDRDILAGAWEPEIYKGLEKCDSFLVVLSDDALRSAWVRKEVDFAITAAKLGKPRPDRNAIHDRSRHRMDCRTISRPTRPARPECRSRNHILFLAAIPSL